MGEETSWPIGPSSEEGLLLSELTHRVTSEFASAISVISMAAARSSGEDAKAILNGASDLLENYAHLHNVLRAQEHATYVDAGTYVRRLCHVISRSKLEVMGIELTLAECPLRMSSADCWRLGMILSELITNAARHAFAKRGSTIHVELSRLGPMVSCRVVDNGTADKDLSSGRGLKVIEALAKRLKGEIEQTYGSQGSTTTIVFPADVD
jgi:two-component sensor histidine kinase